MCGMQLCSLHHVVSRGMSNARQCMPAPHVYLTVLLLLGCVLPAAFTVMMVTSWLRCTPRGIGILALLCSIISLRNVCRHFRCDCGNSRFPADFTCSLLPVSTGDGCKFYV